jgi:glycosyltransferase involved in cell wall biosynthesis
MKIQLLARPDHSVLLYEELRRLGADVDYYTFHAFRRDSVLHRLLPRRKTVPASARTATLFTAIAYPMAVLAPWLGVNARRAEQWLAARALRPGSLDSADIIHYWPFYFAPLVRRLKQRRQAVTLADFYEAEPSFANALFRDAYRKAGLEFRRPFNEMIDQNEAFSFDTDFVVASELTRRSYHQRFPDARIHVVSYGLMGRRIGRTATRRPRRRWVFVGRVCLEKGVDALFDAMAAAPELELDLIGHMPPEQSSYLQRRAAELPNVRMLGQMRNVEVLRALQRYDAFVLPSLCDNYSIAVTEALCAGLAVVVTDHCGNAGDVRRYGVGEVCPAGDPASLASAMRVVAELADDQLAAGLARFDSDETAHPYAARMLDLYDRLLARQE